MRLGDTCQARAGDKGDSSIIVLVPEDPAITAQLGRVITPMLVAAHFRLTEAAVSVRTAQGLGAVTVVLRGRLDGGVTRSAWADPHGKTLAAHLLDMAVPDDVPTEGSS